MYVIEYKFVKTSFNESLLFSSTANFWKHVSTYTYYISRDFCEIIKPTTDYSYMLLHK
jgi:hypothetical protein